MSYGVKEMHLAYLNGLCNSNIDHFRPRTVNKKGKIRRRKYDIYTIKSKIEKPYRKYMFSIDSSDVYMVNKPSKSWNTYEMICRDCKNTMLYVASPDTDKTWINTNCTCHNKKELL